MNKPYIWIWCKQGGTYDNVQRLEEFSDSPLCFLVPVGSDEVGGQNDDSEAFLIPQQHHLAAQTHTQDK